MNRICPECKKSLELNECFFCWSCGHKLEDDLVNWELPAGIEVKNTNLSKKEKNTLKKEDKKLVAFYLLPKIKKYILLFIIVILLLTVGLLSAYSFLKRNGILKKSKPLQVTNISPKESFHAYDLLFGTKNSRFFTTNLSSYASFDSDFYLEGNSLNGKTAELIPAGSELYALYDAVKTTLDGKYAVFGRMSENGFWELALVLGVSNQEVLSQLMKEIKTSLPKEILSGKLIVTNSPGLITSIIQSANQLEKNISHQPKYSSLKALLPQEGQIIFMNFLPDNKELLFLIEKYKLFKANDPVLTKLKSIEYNNFVIRAK